MARVSASPALHLMQRRVTRRTGFSLMEVILATAILLGSVVVLGELAGIGRRQSLRGRELSEAQRLCEQTLNELLTGLRPLEPQEQEPLLPAQRIAEDSFSEQPLIEFSENATPFAFDEDSALSHEDLLAEDSQTARWLHSIRIAPLEAQSGLAVLTVIVEQAPEAAAHPLRFQLSRWIDDPIAAEAEEGRSELRPLDSVQSGERTP